MIYTFRLYVLGYLNTYIYKKVILSKMYQSYMTIQVINFSANLIQLYNEIPIPN